MTKAVVVLSLLFITACLVFDYHVNGAFTQIVRAMMYPY